MKANIKLALSEEEVEQATTLLLSLDERLSIMEQHLITLLENVDAIEHGQGPHEP